MDLHILFPVGDVLLELLVAHVLLGVEGLLQQDVEVLRPHGAAVIRKLTPCV